MLGQGQPVLQAGRPNVGASQCIRSPSGSIPFSSLASPVMTSSATVLANARDRSDTRRVRPSRSFAAVRSVHRSPAILNQLASMLRRNGRASMVTDDIARRYNTLSAEDRRTFDRWLNANAAVGLIFAVGLVARSEEHTSELQSLRHL